MPALKGPKPALDFGKAGLEGLPQPGNTDVSSSVAALLQYISTSAAAVLLYFSTSAAAVLLYLSTGAAAVVLLRIFLFLARVARLAGFEHKVRPPPPTHHQLKCPAH